MAFLLVFSSEIAVRRTKETRSSTTVFIKTPVFYLWILRIFVFTSSYLTLILCIIIYFRVFESFLWVICILSLDICYPLV